MYTIVCFDLNARLHLKFDGKRFVIKLYFLRICMYVCACVCACVGVSVCVKVYIFLFLFFFQQVRPPQSVPFSSPLFFFLVLSASVLPRGIQDLPNTLLLQPQLQLFLTFI